MTVGAHALLALVLIDLRLSALFQRSHGGVFSCFLVSAPVKGRLCSAGIPRCLRHREI